MRIGRGGGGGTAFEFLGGMRGREDREKRGSIPGLLDWAM